MPSMETRNSGDIEFTRKSRGYDPEEVDRFVASVRGELGELQDKLRRLEGGRTGTRRDGGKLHDPDRAVERMLAAAQQTADRVVFDAEAEADRLVSESESEAERLITDAQNQARHRMAEVEAQGEKIRREAVTEARRVVEETRQPLAREVRKLRTTRDGLRSEIDALKRFLNDHRSRVRAIGDSLRSMADDPAALRVAKVPEARPIDVDLSEDFEIDVPSIATSVSTSSAPAATSMIDDNPIDDIDDADSTGDVDQVIEDAHARTQAAAAKVEAEDLADPVDDEPVVVEDSGPELEWGGDDDLDDVDVDVDIDAETDDGGTVISGAFASVLDDEAEDAGADRFHDALKNAQDDGADAAPGGGFFESQIDDPS